MTQDQITALAREYAEEKYPNLDNIGYKTHEALLRLRKRELEKGKQVISFLLRRFCLVEKSKVEEEYNLALSNFEKTGSARPLRQSYFDGRGDAIKSLFPEIGKEVEG